MALDPIPQVEISRVIGLLEMLDDGQAVVPDEAAIADGALRARLQAGLDALGLPYEELDDDGGRAALALDPPTSGL